MGVFNRFILGYIDEERPALERRYRSFDSFREGFNAYLLLDKLISFAEQEGVTYVEEDYQRSKDQIALLMKAYIARDLWENTNFYMIFNESDPIFQKARQVLEEPHYYSDKL